MKHVALGLALGIGCAGLAFRWHQSETEKSARQLQEILEALQSLERSVRGAGTHDTDIGRAIAAEVRAALADRHSDNANAAPEQNDLARETADFMETAAPEPDAHIMRAFDSVSRAVDQGLERGLWTPEDVHSVREQFSQLTPELQQSVSQRLVLAINAGKVTVPDPSALLF